MGPLPLLHVTDAEFIALVVQRFYAKASGDVLIGYHFRRIPDFETHLPRIYAFWEIQLLGQTSIPLAGPLDVVNAHVPLKIHTGEVGRWVRLFEETLDQEARGERMEFVTSWKAKVAHFQKVFLASPRLFQHS